MTTPTPDAGNVNPPPANTPPPTAPTPEPQRPPVVVQANNDAVLNAVNSLPEKLADTFKELFPTNPAPAAPSVNQPQTPPANQPPAAPPANQPPAKRTVADWWFGTKK